MQKAGLVLEGGSFRGIFAAGVLDALMEEQMTFEYVCGISAGAMTAYDYVAGIPGRTRQYYKTICHDPKFFGFRTLLRTGSIFDFDYMYELSNDERREQEETAIENSPVNYEVGATDCVSGEIQFFSKQKMSLKMFNHGCHASSSIPGINDTVMMEGRPYLDGGIACPVAYGRAMDLGYSRILAVTSHELSYREKPRGWMTESILEHKYRQYPNLVRQLRRTDEIHNQQYEELESLQKQGKIFVISPSGKIQIKGLERDPQQLEKLYQEGLHQMRAELPDLKRYLEKQE